MEGPGLVPLCFAGLPELSSEDAHLVCVDYDVGVERFHLLDFSRIIEIGGERCVDVVRRQHVETQRLQEVEAAERRLARPGDLGGVVVAIVHDRDRLGGCLGLQEVEVVPEPVVHHVDGADDPLPRPRQSEDRGLGGDTIDVRNRVVDRDRRGRRGLRRTRGADQNVDLVLSYQLLVVALNYREVREARVGVRNDLDGNEPSPVLDVDPATRVDGGLNRREHVRFFGDNPRRDTGRCDARPNLERPAALRRSARLDSRRRLRGGDRLASHRAAQEVARASRDDDTRDHRRGRDARTHCLPSGDLLVEDAFERRICV